MDVTNQKTPTQSPIQEEKKIDIQTTSSKATTWILVTIVVIICLLLLGIFSLTFISRIKNQKKLVPLTQNPSKTAIIPSVATSPNSPKVTPQPGRSWVISGNTLIQLLITDPTGAQTGFNPITNSNIQNIPGSTYGVQKGLGDDTGVNPPLPDELYFYLNTLANGTYKVQVIGTGSGPYTLESSVSGDSSKQTITGTAAPGKIDTYIVTVQSGQPIKFHVAQ